MVLEGLFVIRPKSVKVGSRLGFSNWEWFATFKASISANDWFAAMLQWLVTVAFTMASSTLSLFRGARQVYFAFQSITFYLCEISVRNRHRPWCWFCPKGSISERPASGTSRIESGESVGQAGDAQAACLPDSEVLLEIVIFVLALGGRAMGCPRSPEQAQVCVPFGRQSPSERLPTSSKHPWDVALHFATEPGAPPSRSLE